MEQLSVLTSINTLQSPSLATPSPTNLTQQIRILEEDMSNAVEGARDKSGDRVLRSASA